MPLTPQQIEACVDAAAAALQLPLAPEHRPGVLQFFGLSAAMADLVMGLPLAVHDEPAPVFEPVAPAAEPRA